MRYKVIASLVLLISTSVAWADPVGTWEISMDGPGGTMVNYLTIRKAWRCPLRVYGQLAG